MPLPNRQKVPRYVDSFKHNSGVRQTDRSVSWSACASTLTRDKKLSVIILVPSINRCMRSYTLGPIREVIWYGISADLRSAGFNIIGRVIAQPLSKVCVLCAAMSALLVYILTNRTGVKRSAAWRIILERDNVDRTQTS